MKASIQGLSPINTGAGWEALTQALPRTHYPNQLRSVIDRCSLPKHRLTALESSSPLPSKKTGVVAVKPRSARW